MNAAVNMAIELARDLKNGVQARSIFRDGSFEEQSACRWAMDEVIFRLATDDEPPLVVIENFREEMMRYSRLNKYTQHLFTAAEKITDELANELCKGDCQ